MASRPAKRQRRGTVPSDEEERPDPAHLLVRTPKKQTQLELGGQNGSPLTLSPSPSKIQRKNPAGRKKSATASPKTTAKRAKTGQEKETAANKRLSTFFGKATEEQRWHRKSLTPERDVVDDVADDDIVDDDLSDEALLGVEEMHSDNTRNPLDRRKQAATNDRPVLNSNSVLLSSSRRFVTPSVPAKRPSTDSDAAEADKIEEQHRPWAERYGPTNLDELSVHKKKVQDVQKWLDDTLSGKSRLRLLLLKGPAGSGKSTTISLLSRTLGFLPVPWHNPVAYEAATGGSIAAQFDDFLNRGGQYGSLSFGSVVSQSSPAVLLVEEFPAAMTRSTGSDSFRSVILQFLARSLTTAAPFQPSQSAPLVMIVSETLLSSSTSFSDSFTAHRLLGPEILNHPLVTVMDFNPVAPTYIAKALHLVIKKEARDSKRRRVPGPAVIQNLADMGDVRNAVNTLEFLCVRDTEADWSGTVAARPKIKDGTSLTEMEKSSLKLVTQRETTLDMFHAAGKIMYNKRDDPRILDSQAEPPPKPPDHLIHLYSPKVSQVDIEALLNETGTDIQTFISTLHENYVLSCNGDTFIVSQESCSDLLSISDVLNPDSRRQIRSKSNMTSALQANISTGSSDTLRQDEISFNVATRGLLLSLPYPVNRAAPSSGRKSDSYKMFYPASLRLWKPMEEIHSLISLFAVLDHNTQSSAGKEGVAAWKNTTFGIVQASPDEKVEDTRKLRPTIDELNLETLPYLTHIRQAKKQDVKTLSKITQFHGLVPVLMAGDEPDDEEPKDEKIIKSEKVNAAAKLMEAKGKRGTKENGMDVDVEKLYLEDDDIIDD